MTIEQLNRLCPDYHFTKELGRGSFGTVYAAESANTLSDRHYAVKLITIPSGPEALKSPPYLGRTPQEQQRFIEEEVIRCLREAEIVISMDSCPNILTVYAARTISLEQAPMQAVLIFMERALRLDDYLLDDMVPVAEYRRIGIDLCTALAECESRQIVHRDIKPDNVFVTENGTCMLGDFGLADRQSEDVTSFALKGTRSYMAPEVFKGNPPGSRSDLYSLGLLLYYIYNNCRLPFLEGGPFSRTVEAENEAFRKRIEGETLPPPEMATEAIAAIILKACSFRPEDRFENADAMRTALSDPEAWYSRRKQEEAEKAAAEQERKAAEEARRRRKHRKLLALVLAAAVLLAMTGVQLYRSYLPYRLALESSEYEEDVPPVIIDWAHAGLEDHPIHFPDPYVDEAVRRAIDRPEGDLMLSDVFHITLLRVDHYDELDQYNDIDENSEHILQSTQVSGACDLTGLEELMNLQELTVEEGNLQDISPLAPLVNLESLSITSNASLTDIGPLRSMNRLKDLDLSYCGVSDLSPLAALSELQSLNICGNPVKDMNALRNLKCLQELYAADCPAEDWSVLSALTNLKTLHLSRTSFAEPALLAGLTQLEELDLIELELDDLQGLTGLEHLQQLDLQDCRIKDYTALEQLYGLVWLNLSGTSFSDTGLLSGMKDMETLILCGSQVRDLTPLLQLKHLQLLDISGLEIRHDQTYKELSDRLGDGLYEETQ